MQSIFAMQATQDQSQVLDLKKFNMNIVKSREDLVTITPNMFRVFEALYKVSKLHKRSLQYCITLAYYLRDF